MAVDERWGRQHTRTIVRDGGKTMKPAPIKELVTIDDLAKLDIRVGTIEAVEDVEGSKKLVKLTVNLGDQTRTILAGMKLEREDLTEIIGKQALFVVNLAPRKMAGVMSEGMLFDLGYEDGVNPALATPERLVPNGTRAG
jgi:tRNA-binding protein